MSGPDRVVIPSNDLIDALEKTLTKYGVKKAGFEEVVRQCLDVYMDWSGDEEQIALLPYFNRIDIPALAGDDYQEVYQAVQHAVHTFAREIFVRLMRYGFFPKCQTRPNMDYAFERFLGQDIVLFHFNF